MATRKGGHGNFQRNLNIWGCKKTPYTFASPKQTLSFFFSSYRFSNGFTIYVVIYTQGNKRKQKENKGKKKEK